MKVIITGGTGLIGRAVAARLVARGDEVTVLTRDLRHASRVPDGVKAATWDGKTGAGWSALIDGDTAIVNLAGAGLADAPWTDARKKELWDSRVAAGRAVAEAIRDRGATPRVVVQSSAVGYYGPRDDTEITESATPGVDFLARLCVAWEGSTAAVESAGVRRAIIRTGVVLSRDGGALPKLMLPFTFFVGGPLGSGRQGVPWIHLADAVAAIELLLDRNEASGAYNLTAPYPVTNAEFARALATVMHRPSRLPMPAVVLRAVFGEMSTVLLDGQRAVPTRLLETGFTYRFTTINEALANLFGSR